VLRLIADENFNQGIVEGLRRLVPDVDVVLAKDVALLQTDDQIILEWAAVNQRIVVTHDVATMPGYAYERVEAGLPMPGVFAVPSMLSIGRAVEDLVTLTACSRDDEWDASVIFLPL
jgi:Domain of unknown function (DUF5615)